METLKIQVKRDVFEALESGNQENLSVDLTAQLAKRVSESGASTPEELMEDGKLLKKFDELYVSCIFSSDNVTLPITGMGVSDGKLNFTLGAVKREEPVEKPVEPKKAETRKEGKPAKKEAVKPLGERISGMLDDFCKGNTVYTVGVPIVTVLSDGVLFGLNRRLPIKNDVAFKIEIERERVFFQDDMTDDECVKDFDRFLKMIVRNNFVFVWRKKCAYHEKDSKRYVSMFYATRRFVTQTKKLL